MSDYSRKTRMTALAMSLWLVMDTSGLAMQSLDDAELAEESGAGLAFPFTDFSLQMANTSFIELIGDPPNPAATTFVRGDLRYYGLSLTNGNTASGVDWSGAACTGGFFGLGCPRNNSVIGHYSDFDNPFVLRTFNQNRYGTSDTGGDPTTKLHDRTVLELIGPSDMDPFRWAFYGEMEAGRNGANNTCAAGSGLSNCLLKAQNIILGKPASRLKPVSVGGSNDTTNPYSGPVLRLMQYMGTTADNGIDPRTYGVTYDSRLSGDYRFSVNASAINSTRGSIPTFTAEEGLYFKNVQAYLPLGQLHYQALVFDDAQPGSTGTSITNGNIAILVTRIPNYVEAYRDFYSFVDGTAGSANSGYNRVSRPNRYYQTHGYVEWGDKFPINTNSNGAGGTGVSTVRFAGVDPDGSTKTINAANFPIATFMTGKTTTQTTVNYDGTDYTVQAANFSNGQTSVNCTSPNTCTFNGGNMGDAFTGVSTRSQVVEAGGMVFVSSSAGSTWTVVNNQNLPEQASGNMLWINNITSTPAANTAWTYSYRLERDGRYPGAGYNPRLTVNAINLGHSRVLGMSINHLRIETLGGQ